MIVADTNLLVYLYVAGQRTGQAETALAQDLGIAFITSDRQVLTAFPTAVVSLDLFTA